MAHSGGEYREFVRLADPSTLIPTASGGGREEVPTLGKPVLMMCDRTGRPDLIGLGCRSFGRHVGRRPVSPCKAKEASAINEGPFSGHSALAPPID